MNDLTPDISIVLLIYNGAEYLSEVLAAVFAQKTVFTYEVIAIDSGSRDGSLEIVKEFPVVLIQIANAEFGHGRTRNLGARYASGKYVVFLTQDATPANECWLDRLVHPLAEHQQIAGAYSRQLPRPNCNPWEARDIGLGSGPISSVKRVDFDDHYQKADYLANQSRFMLFSNVSSCIRKGVLEQLPFAENIVMMEDQEWCKRAIEAGHWIAYESASVVYHSHNHSLGMIYKRHFDYGVSLQKFAPMPMGLKDVFAYTIFQTFADLMFIFPKRGICFLSFKWIAKSTLIRFAMRFGLYMGLRDTTESLGGTN